MIAFPDTSFLCALYRQQANSVEAAKLFQKMPEPLHVSALLLFEFRQSTRFQGFLHGQNAHKGFSKVDGLVILQNLQSDIAGGAVVVTAVEWADVYSIAEQLSAKYTLSHGHRGFDILHIATAFHLGAREFLTFNANQKKLALAEGIKVPL